MPVTTVPPPVAPATDGTTPVAPPPAVAVPPWRRPAVDSHAIDPAEVVGGDVEVPVLGWGTARYVNLDNARKLVRGPFGYQTSKRIADLYDGTSNTILMGELTTSRGGRDSLGGVLRNQGNGVVDNPASCLVMVDKASGQFLGTDFVSTSRGSRWAGGMISYTTVNTILTTNNLVANPWVRYSEGLKTGCMIVDFDSDRVQADWYHVANANDPDSAVNYAASWQTKLGTNRLTKATSPLTLRRQCHWSLTGDISHSRSKTFLRPGRPTTRKLQVIFKARIRRHVRSHRKRRAKTLNRDERKMFQIRNK